MKASQSFWILQWKAFVNWEWTLFLLNWIRCENWTSDPNLLECTAVLNFMCIYPPFFGQFSSNGLNRDYALDKSEKWHGEWLTISIHSYDYYINFDTKLHFNFADNNVDSDVKNTIFRFKIEKIIPKKCNMSWRFNEILFRFVWKFFFRKDRISRY